MKRLLTIFCGTALGLSSLAGAASAQELPPPAPSVDQRLERLEKLNETLLKQNQELKQEVQTLKVRATESPVSTGTVDRSEVQNIVSQYLQQQADKGKAEAKGDGWYQVGSDTKMSASWKNGLMIESAQKDFTMNIGGRINQDFGWFSQTQASRDALGGGTAPALGTLQDGTNFRRARISGFGTCYEIFEWAAEFEFAGVSDLLFDDLWFGASKIPVIGGVRVGHIKVPMGLESNTSSRYLTFMERGSVFEAFMEEYDPGIVILNDALNQRITWQAAAHRIDPEGDGIDYGTGDYAATGRVTFLPLYENDGLCLVHLGASGQYRSGEAVDVGKLHTRVQRYRTRAPFRNRQATYPRFVDTGVFESDHANFFAAEAAAVWGPLSVQAEYVYCKADDASQPIKGTFFGDVNFSGYYIYVSYFLTGEHRPYDKRLGRFARVIPNENFFLVKGEDDCRHFGRGAWEVAFRYDYLDLTNKGIHGGVMHDYTAALNWYVNPNMKIQFNYIVANREVDAPGNGDPVHIWGVRFHYDF